MSVTERRYSLVSFVTAAFVIVVTQIVAVTCQVAVRTVVIAALAIPPAAAFRTVTVAAAMTRV